MKTAFHFYGFVIPMVYVEIVEESRFAQRWDHLKK